ncbi:ZPR1 zinc finger domain-containing protein, partial [Candidatus Woesearchaeota archaeon]|nr:ZPR1 zinc finger domain-containing protein [Candidatus Woesearchaeota archaeon]
MADEEVHVLAGQKCPMCGKKTLALTEAETEVPFFGKVLLFSMSCEECKYHKSDVESMEQHEPSRWTFEIDNEKDMHIRVVKSAEATVKIPHMITIESGPSSNGYVTNIEGVLNRVKKMIETVRDQEEDEEAR